LGSGSGIVLENIGVLIGFDDSEDLLGIFFALVEKTFSVDVRDLKRTVLSFGGVVFNILVDHFVLIKGLFFQHFAAGNISISDGVSISFRLHGLRLGELSIRTEGTDIF
jgi:hypothetical protein